MKTAADYMEEANAAVPRLSAEDAVKLHGTDTVFIDVRDGTAVAETGTIEGAVRLPRGMLEFVADDSHALHNPLLKKDGSFAVICAAGGQAALAGKTMKDMGFTDVVNIGGLSDWIKAGGAVEEG